MYKKPATTVHSRLRSNMMSGKNSCLYLITFLLLTAITSGKQKIPICHRHKHMDLVGFDALTLESKTDIGRCKLRYVRQNKIEQEWAVCQAGDECSATSVDIEHFHLYGGESREVSIVRGCQCQNPAQSCQRGVFNKTFFPRTKYETTVDVGKCGGPCAVDKTCLPIRNTTKMIETPNGPTAMQSIIECSCSVPMCHRVPFFDEFMEEYVNDKNETSSKIRRLDVGKCLGDGSCHGQVEIICLKWENGTCIYKGKHDKKCRPATFTNATFRAIGGHQTSLAIINSCECF